MTNDHTTAAHDHAPAESAPPRTVAWGARASLAAPVLALFAIGVGIPIYTADMRTAAATSRLLVANGATLGVLILLILSLLGLHGLVAHRLRTAGHAGFVLALVGTVLASGGAWDSLFALPYLAEAAPTVLDTPTTGTLLVGFVVSYLVLVLGWALFAVACLRTRAVPRYASIMILAGALLAIVPAPTALRLLVLTVGVALANNHLLRPESGTGPLLSMRVR